jgi:hypothetical protein
MINGKINLSGVWTGVFKKVVVADFRALFLLPYAEKKHHRNPATL